jgi:hypothetical protein
VIVEVRIHPHAMGAARGVSNYQGTHGSSKTTHACTQQQHAAEHALSRAHGQQSTQQSMRASSMHASEHSRSRACTGACGEQRGIVLWPQYLPSGIVLWPPHRGHGNAALAGWEAGGGAVWMSAWSMGGAQAGRGAHARGEQGRHVASVSWDMAWFRCPGPSAGVASVPLAAMEVDAGAVGMVAWRRGGA